MSNNKKIIKELEELKEELSDNTYQYGWIASRIEDILFYMNKIEEDE